MSGTDSLSILQAISKQKMTKVWRSDGVITPYSQAQTFMLEQREVTDIHGLAALLDELAKRWDVGLIRGRYIGEELARPLLNAAGIKKGCTFRRNTVFRDQPLHSTMIDIDKFKPTMGDPVTDPVPCIREYIARQLPEAFHACSFYWQLSSSAGAPGNEATLKAHVWFWLAEPRTSAQMNAWGKRHAMDVSVFQTVHIHYTAAPLFEEGARDPVPVRSGFVEGYLSDEVEIELDAYSADAKETVLEIAPRRAEDAKPDPVADFIIEHGWFVDNVKDGVLAVRCPLESFHTPGNNDPSQTVWFPAGVGGRAQGGFQCMHKDHGGKGEIKTAQFLDLIGFPVAELMAQEFPIVETPVDLVTTPDGEVLERKPVPSPKICPRDKAGKIMTTEVSLKAYLERPDLMRAFAGIDVFKDRLMWVDCDEYGRPCATPRPFIDTDYQELRIRLRGLEFGKIGMEDIKAAVKHTAQNHARFDSAIEWLSRLEWDGVPRVDAAMHRIFGTVDTPYARSVGRYLFTALAGRILVPGVQADMAPILIGRQGARKTSAVRELAPNPDAFVEVNLNKIDQENTTRSLRGRCVVELGELRGLMTKDRDEIKGWITRRREDLRPLFGEYTGEFWRRFVCIGTTNKTAILADSTGERRWLPIRVGEIDLETLQVERDQLWAEGAHMFKTEGGVQWQEAEELAKEEHGHYASTDPWVPAVEAWLNRDVMDDDAGGDRRGDVGVQAHEALVGALRLTEKELNKVARDRMADIFESLGMVSKPVRRTKGGKPEKCFIFQVRRDEIDASDFC